MNDNLIINPVELGTEILWQGSSHCETSSSTDKTNGCVMLITATLTEGSCAIFRLRDQDGEVVVEFSLDQLNVPFKLPDIHFQNPDTRLFYEPLIKTGSFRIDIFNSIFRDGTVTHRKLEATRNGEIEVAVIPETGPQAFIVSGTTGDHGDRTVWNFCVTSTQEQAEEITSALNKILEEKDLSESNWFYNTPNTDEVKVFLGDPNFSYDNATGTQYSWEAVPYNPEKLVVPG